MPRIGERFASELSWQEELGIEPVGGFPSSEDMAKMTNDQIIDGLVRHVEYRNSTTGISAKFWELYSIEFLRRVTLPRQGTEDIRISLANKLLKLLKNKREVRVLVNNLL